MATATETQRASESPPTVLYDGVCGLCDRAVQFLLPRDRDGALHFAALQSEFGQGLLRAHGIDAEYRDSIVFVDDGVAHLRSTAILHITRRLKFPWNLARVGFVLPRPLRDGLYKLVARYRYRLFGRLDSCRVPTEEHRVRFHD